MKFRAEVAGSDKKLKKQMKQRSKESMWMARVEDDGRVVQFLTEPIEWVKFEEVYENKTFRPVLEGERTDEKPSTRYLAPAIDLEDGERVIALKMPLSLAKDVIRRYERRGTITDRPWELTRTGKGLDTEYYADPMEPEDGVDIDDLDVEIPDLMQYLEAAYAEAMGIDDDDEWDEDWDDEPVKPKPRRKAKPRRRDDDDEDVPRRKPKSRQRDEDDEPKPKKAKKKGKKKAKPKDSATRKLTVTEIDNMSTADLREHLEDLGVDFPHGTRSRAVLEDLLAEHYGEEPF